MLIPNHRLVEPAPSEITPAGAYIRRRTLLAMLAASAPGAASADEVQRPGRLPSLNAAPMTVPGADSLEKPTAYADLVSYNNFSEFGADKGAAARHAGNMKTMPWTVEIQGLVRKPARYHLEHLLRLATQEDRVYRFRCVEGWSMVVPWVGYSLSRLIAHVEPLGSAKYVEFFSQVDPVSMPGLAWNPIEWPYAEGLRMDEALHPLTLLTFGMYGEVLPNQNGGPVRVTVPWKYGFKSGKSIVRIRFSEQMPRTSWSRVAPREYGFYANVNPDVDHPRWSQATERRIGHEGLFARRTKTLMFNGYEPQVGQLYAGMDLRKLY